MIHRMSPSTWGEGGGGAHLDILLESQQQQACVLASTLVRVHCNETNTRAFEAIRIQATNAAGF